MKRVYKFNIKKDEYLDNLCEISNNLYNQANYIVRQEFIKNGKWIRYLELNNTLRSIKENNNYKLLKAQWSQQILKLLDKNWYSFFKAIKDWKIHPKKYLGKPKLPKYKKKGDKNILILTNQSSSIRDDKVIVDKNCSIDIPQPDYVDFSKFQQIRILPKRFGYIIEIVYDIKQKEIDLDDDRHLSIDLGLNNLIAMIDNVNSKPIIIKGKVLKAINQYWNKRKAKMYSQNKGKTKMCDIITDNRNNIVNDYLHKVSRFIIDYCIDNKIKNIWIGDLKNIKQNINMGRRNNQNFVNIPLQKLIHMITYKGEEVGINTKIKDEAYTSKVSALDLEIICKHKEYIGRRIKRGLFQATKQLINADVNGCLNIMRQAIGDSVPKQIIDRGFLFNPLVLDDVFHLNYKQNLLKECNSFA